MLKRETAQKLPTQYLVQIYSSKENRWMTIWQRFTFEEYLFPGFKAKRFASQLRRDSGWNVRVVKVYHKENK